VREPSIKIPVTCPECARETVGEFQIAVIATALITGKNLRLYAACHDVYWTATAVERDQMRKHLAAISIDAREGGAQDLKLSDSMPAKAVGGSS
jgi:hypothetical protein